MKQSLALLGFLGLCMAHSAFAAADKASSNAPFNNKTDKISYSIGVDVGKSISKQGIEINPDIFAQGLKDAKDAKNVKMTDEQVRETLLALQTELVEKQKKEARDLAAKNLADGEKFLADNKKNKDVVTRPSGLEYRIIKEGSGASPKATDSVTTHYKGKLIDGKEFDSSYTRGEPVKFPVNGVIPGWTEALQLMKPGAKWELFIPAKLAYGENGLGQIIGPNSTLIFDIELISVEKPTAAKANKASAKADPAKAAAANKPADAKKAAAAANPNNNPAQADNDNPAAQAKEPS